MFSPTLLSIAMVLITRSTTAEVNTCSTTPCDDIHFFLARGNNEPYPGRQALLVAATCSGLSSCGYEDLVYSALYTDLSCQTTYDGAIAGHVQIVAYVEACPDSKLVLAGYSQGAQIVTDILGGGGGVSFNGCVQPSTPALDRGTSPGSNIAAAIIFGNTRHTASQPYNYGNASSINGLFPRSTAQLSSLNSYSDILRDWCDLTDPICVANQEDSEVATHLAYYDKYSDVAASWIKSVASLSDDSKRVTSIPISVSGTAQDYATIGTATPSGTVTLDMTWTEHTAVVACTGDTSSRTTSAPSSRTTKSAPNSINTSSTTSQSQLSNETAMSLTSTKSLSSTSSTTTSSSSSTSSTNIAATPNVDTCLFITTTLGVVLFIYV